MKATIGGVGQEFIYDLAHHHVAVVSSSTLLWNLGEIYAGNWHLGTYAGGGTYFVHADWLGTVRSRTDYSGAVYQNYSSLPFGDALSNVGIDWAQFTDQDRDNESGLDHFLFRQYSSVQGRWMTPDPSGLSFADQTDPQSLNMYEYARNNPLNFFDSNGLGYCQWSDGSTDDRPQDGGATQQECEGDPNNEGTWIYESGDTQEVQNEDGTVQEIQTPSSEMTINGDTGEVTYTDSYFANSDEPLSPQQTMIFTLAYMETQQNLGCVMPGFGLATVAAGSETNAIGSRVWTASQNVVPKTKAAGAMGATTATSEAAIAARASWLSRVPSGGLKSPTGSIFSGDFKMRTSPNLGVAAGRY